MKDKILLYSITCIFVIQILATWFLWYYRFWWFDIPMHVIGGAWVGLLFFYLFKDKWNLVHERTSLIQLLLLALGFVALVGVVWEFYEYISEAIATNSPLIVDQAGRFFDTLKDLFDDLAGGAIVTTIVYFRTRKRVD